MHTIQMTKSQSAKARSAPLLAGFARGAGYDRVKFQWGSILTFGLAVVMGAHSVPWPQVARRNIRFILQQSFEIYPENNVLKVTDHSN
jgi:hypothetical protein